METAAPYGPAAPTDPPQPGPPRQTASPVSGWPRTALDHWISETTEALRGGDAAKPLALIACVAAGAVAALTFGGDGGSPTKLALFVVSVAAALLMARAVVSRSALVLLALGLALTAVLFVRDSAWVVLPTVLGIMLCFGGAAAFGRSGSPFDVTWPRLALAAFRTAANGLIAPFWLAQGARTMAPAVPRRRTYAVLRGLIIAVPLGLILISLLSAADSLFDAAVSLNVTFDGVVLRGILFGCGAVVAGGLVRLALEGRTSAASGTAGAGSGAGTERTGHTEVIIVLSFVALVFAAFVATQVAALTGMGRAELERAGISYADYARSGYFQLLAVMVITVVLLTVTNSVTKRLPTRAYRAQQALSLAIIFMTLVIAAVALQRLAMYCDEFGLTMLRLACVPAAAWMIAVLLLLAGWTLRARRRRYWLPGAMGLAAVLIIGAFGALNPERLVISYDIAHSPRAALDIAYLAGLSDDVVPDLVASLPSLPEPQRATLRTDLCARSIPAGNWPAVSISQIQARSALATICP